MIVAKVGPAFEMQAATPDQLVAAGAVVLGVMCLVVIGLVLIDRVVSGLGPRR